MRGEFQQLLPYGKQVGHFVLPIDSKDRLPRRKFEESIREGIWVRDGLGDIYAPLRQRRYDHWTPADHWDSPALFQLRRFFDDRIYHYAFRPDEPLFLSAEHPQLIISIPL